MSAPARAAFFTVAMTSLAFACGTFGTNEDPAPADDAGSDDAGSEATVEAADSTVGDSGATCIAQGLGPPPPEDPTCGTNGAPFDLTKTDSHCGACNHSCLGTGCENGRCKVVDIGAPLDTNNAGVSVFAQLPLPGIHYGDALAVKRLSEDGGSAEVLGDLVDAGNGVRHFLSLHSDDEQIIVTVAGRGVYTIPAEGGAVTPVEEDVFPYAAVIVKGLVYWMTANTIYVKIPSVGSTPWINEPGATLVGFTADTERVYWAARPDDGGAGVSVKMSPATSVSIVQIRATVPDAEGLVVKDGYLYWLDGTKIYRASVDTIDPPTAIAELAIDQDRTRVRALVVDATHVYWAMSHPSYNSISIFKASKCGGPTTMIADTSAGSGYGMAFDDRFLYFGETRVRRLAK